METYSHSSLTLFNHCPYDWYLRYVKKIKEPFNLNFVWGNAVHDAQEFFSLSQINGFELSKNEVKEFIVNKVEESNIEEEDKDKLLSLARNVADNIIETEDYQMARTEIYFKIPFYNFQLSGRLDGITEDDKVFELKTSAGKYDLEKIKSTYQRVLYEIAFRHLMGRPSNGVIYKVIYKRVKPSTDFFYLQVSEEEIEECKKWVLSTVLKIREAKETNNFPKSRNCKINNFRDLCFMREHCDGEN